MKKFSFVAIAIVLLFSVFAAGTYFYNSQKADEANANAQKNNSVLERAYSPSIGNKDAKVTIVEFFDPACGTCKAFSPFLKELMEAYPGKIRLVMRYLPLHQGSDEVVKILEAANQQNKFWGTLSAAYVTQSSWTKHHVAQPDEFWRMVSYTKLDIEKAKQDVKSTVISKRIQQDIADAKKLNVTKTPGFFVNGKPLTRFGYQQLQDLVETELLNNYK
ncbi:MAG: thioredoxin domain-containing protein [Sulfuriflexus sp.]|nr:thioredoxin domain-containing protein [Sulfuriflexus sp.]